MPIIEVVVTAPAEFIFPGHEICRLKSEWRKPGRFDGARPIVSVYHCGNGLAIRSGKWPRPKPIAMNRILFQDLKKVDAVNCGGALIRHIINRDNVAFMNIQIGEIRLDVQCVVNERIHVIEMTDGTLLTFAEVHRRPVSKTIDVV